MADPGIVYPSEIHLLKQELEAQSELLSQERVAREAEADLLRLELHALKQLLDRIKPGSLQQYEQLYAEARQSWNPELERKEA